MQLRHQFADAIRQRRSELGVTQEELAWRAGVHRSYLASIESGARNPSLESIGKLARALEVSLAMLFGTTEKPSAAAACADRSDGVQLGLVDILIVEDNPDDLALTVEAFREARVANRLQVVEDGAAALDYLFPKSGGRGAALPRPHLILLDLGLPQVSGLDVLRRIRSDRRTRHTPVIIMTGSRDERDFAECRRLGVDQYLLKPVDFCSLSAITPRLSLNWALLKESQPPGGTRRKP